MEREYLVEGAIVIFVLVVIALIFISSSAEIRKDIGNVIDDVFGFGKKEKARLEGEDAFKLWKSSMEKCSGDSCACLLARGYMVEGYTLFLKNENGGINLLLFSDEGELLKDERIDSSVIGLMKRVAVRGANSESEKQEYLVCELRDALKLDSDSSGYWQITDSVGDFNPQYRVYGGPDIRGLMSLGKSNGKKVLCLLTQKIESRYEMMNQKSLNQLSEMGLVVKINYSDEDRNFFGGIDFEGAAKKYLENLEWCKNTA